MMIDSVKATKILSKGYLAYIVNILDKVALGLKDTLVVCEFPSVFLDNLLRLSPKKVIEFSIELSPCITLISKTPSKITLVKLQ